MNSIKRVLLLTLACSCRLVSAGLTEPTVTEVKPTERTNEEGPYPSTEAFIDCNRCKEKGLSPTANILCIYKCFHPSVTVYWTRGTNSISRIVPTRWPRYRTREKGGWEPFMQGLMSETKGKSSLKDGNQIEDHVGRNKETKTQLNLTKQNSQPLIVFNRGYKTVLLVFVAGFISGFVVVTLTFLCVKSLVNKSDSSRKNTLSHYPAAITPWRTLQEKKV
ncbi:uncharacterized protein LOC130613096 [Hydractinia symbiolongicarpus]|uniref:uncharacterized protein LOC130613096 n=1 Tax=Hydractinia symbiolongicarpus TaxID=13093 RepID=UPI002550037E|nr:uncharacterized protein LOC130613096 [Hydractinia symbiolongicarpus]